MARYIYIYRTSDGVRREASIRSASRENAFAELRERGIRPIKVIAADGSKENGEVRRIGVSKMSVSAIAAAVLVAGLAVGVLWSRIESSDGSGHGMSGPYSDEEYAAYSALEKKSDVVMHGLAKAIAGLRVEEINNPSNVAAHADVAKLYKRAHDSQSSIDRARRETRDAFASIATDFPPDGAAIRDAQRLYGERMAELDAVEVAISNRKFALAILDGNRDKWTLVGDEAVFEDKRLARMYKYCLEGIEADGSTARWQRDFAPTAE